MAELAIPLVALGGLYVASNASKGGAKPAATVAPNNFPTTQPVSQANPNYYPDPNQSTDKYYNEQVYQKVAQTNPPGSVGSGVEQTVGLLGQPIDKTSFRHNNMVPFFGAKVRGASVDHSIAEGRLDNMQGSGSQLIEKCEQEPLFKPQHSLSFNAGTPNQTDFYRSRVNESLRQNNVAPCQKQSVGPGLGLGYGTEGSGGLNSGTGEREKWLPKTVNQLRTTNNPKITFGLGGHEGPLGAPVQNPATQATQGQVNKYLPDTYYKNSPDRWFTTMGAEHGQTLRPITEMDETMRSLQTEEYFGVQGGERREVAARPVIHPSSRPEGSALPPAPPSMEGASHPHELDYGRSAQPLLRNHRSSTRQATRPGALVNAVQALVTPIVDSLRPTRKQDSVGNPRPNGNVQISTYEVPVWNPGDRVKTTLKEMTLSEGRAGIPVGRSDGGYQVATHEERIGQRPGTSVSYVGNGAAPTGDTLYDAAYRQRNNDKKATVDYTAGGCNGSFNATINADMRKKVPARVDQRTPPGQGPVSTPSLQTYGDFNAPQYYNTCIGCDRINPDILDAFKKNPYTQSLHSWA